MDPDPAGDAQNTPEITTDAEAAEQPTDPTSTPEDGADAALTEADTEQDTQAEAVVKPAVNLPKAPQASDIPPVR